MKTLREIIIVLAALTVLFFVLNRRPREIVRIEHQTDTLVIRDTIRIPVPEPYVVEVVRVDTVFMANAKEEVDEKSDTGLIVHPADSTRVVVPIERREYRTDDYLAVIQGYRPELVSMALFPRTSYITDTQVKTITKRTRWGIGIQAGYGYCGQKFQPYVGIGIQYSIWSW